MHTHTHTHTKCACTTHTGECPLCLCLCARAAIYMSFMKERRDIRSRKLGFRDSALRSAHSVIPRSSNAEYPDTRNNTELPHGITEYRARNRARCNHGIIGWLLVPEDDETRQKQQDAMMLLWPMLLRGLQATSESKQQQLTEVHEVSKMLQDIAGDAAASDHARPPCSSATARPSVTSRTWDVKSSEHWPRRKNGRRGATIAQKEFTGCSRIVVLSSPPPACPPHLSDNGAAPTKIRQN